MTVVAGVYTIVFGDNLAEKPPVKAAVVDHATDVPR